MFQENVFVIGRDDKYSMTYIECPTLIFNLQLVDDQNLHIYIISNSMRFISSRNSQHSHEVITFSSSVTNIKQLYVTNEGHYSSRVTNTRADFCNHSDAIVTYCVLIKCTPYFCLSTRFQKKSKA